MLQVEDSVFEFYRRFDVIEGGKRALIIAWRRIKRIHSMCILIGNTLMGRVPHISV